ncbi:MAG: effector binding domain-containing protein [Acidobacteriaceae bacterium]|nr:effector binding domain-containing protein [Acidobacteriaceae bacterium]
MSFLLTCLATVLVTAATPSAQESKPIKVHVDSFPVMGIFTVTTNERESSPEALIPRMWARLRTEDILGRIPNRLDNEIIAVYCDYENGRKGSYKYVLGARVSPTKFVPRGMVIQTVEGGTYARYNAEGAPPPVVELWKQIWSDEKPGGLERAYHTDYEVHPAGLAENASRSRIDIYIELAK